MVSAVCRHLDCFAEVVEEGDGKGSLLDGDRDCFGDGVFVTILAAVGLALLGCGGEQVGVGAYGLVVGEAEQDVVELQVGVDELALGVQEVEGQADVLEDLLGEGEGEVSHHAPGLLDVARRGIQQEALVAAAPLAVDVELALRELEAPQAGVGGGGGASADELKGSLLAGVPAGVLDANF